MRSVSTVTSIKHVQEGFSLSFPPLLLHVLKLTFAIVIIVMMKGSGMRGEGVRRTDGKTSGVRS